MIKIVFAGTLAEIIRELDQLKVKHSKNAKVTLEMID